MEEKRRKEGVLERTAKALDLPADGLAGLPHVDLVGDHELRVENHKGILSYGDKEIHVGAGKMVIRVKGEGLRLRVMNVEELLITGQITGIEVV